MKILVVAASQVLDNPLLSNTERACSLEASVTETAKGRRCFGVRVLERGRTGERTVAIGERTDAALDFGGTVLRPSTITAPRTVVGTIERGSSEVSETVREGDSSEPWCTESKVKLGGGGESGPRQPLPNHY